MKNNIIYLILITFCCSCSHSNPNAAADGNKTEDTIVSPAPQIMTRDFREEVITALYMMGCNDRLEMGLPDDYTENYYGFLNQIDSMMETPNYFERIEANIANDSYSQDLQDSLQRWLFLEQMLLFPQDCDLDLFEYGVTDEMPQTHHLLDKYINRDIQGIESLSFSQLDFYLFDIINYLMSLPDKEQVEFIIEYYSRIKDAPNLQ
jgi:hypothetical protein